MMWLNWLQAGEAHKQEMVGELKIGGFQLPPATRCVKRSCAQFLNWRNQVFTLRTRQ
jgi:hypothetical protein